VTTFYFGPRWDAPLLDENAEQVPTPVGEVCFGCNEPIREADRGLLRSYVAQVDGEWVATAASGARSAVANSI